MPNKAGRVTEHDVASAVLRYLAEHHGGEATINELVRVIPDRMSLKDADLAQSESRPNERVWEQQVRNIISHRDVDGNAIHDGLLEYTARGLDRHGRLKITDAGRYWVTERAA